MYVCLCHAVTDRKIRKAIARGATSVDEITRACGAGSGCGGCRPELDALLRAATGADAGSPVEAPRLVVSGGR